MTAGWEGRLHAQRQEGADHHWDAGEQPAHEQDPVDVAALLGLVAWRLCTSRVAAGGVRLRLSTRVATRCWATNSCAAPAAVRLLNISSKHKLYNFARFSVTYNPTAPTESMRRCRTSGVSDAWFDGGLVRTVNQRLSCKNLGVVVPICTHVPTKFMGRRSASAAATSPLGLEPNPHLERPLEEVEWHGGTHQA